MKYDPVVCTNNTELATIARLDSRLNDIEERTMNTVDKKATLLLGGPVKIPQNMELPFRTSCSTAGPGAGSTGIVLAFEGTRVKKAISRERGDFELVPGGGKYSLWRDGEVFVEEVRIEPVVFHAPEQAFFNLDNRCIYGCSFCASPLLEESREKGHTPEKVVQMIIEAHRKDGFDAVAITSGVPDTPERTVGRIAQVVSGVRKALPSVTIGVEPYVDDLSQIDLLKEAGADEIKLNIETYDRDIFGKVCGRKDYELILRSVERAVEVFGRGRVTSNIIIGLGESDETVLRGVEDLAETGCVATLRALRTNNMNRGALAEVAGGVKPVDKDRLLRLVRAQKDILERHGLSTLTFETMCNRCGCCDIVPFVDIK